MVKPTSEKQQQQSEERTNQENIRFTGVRKRKWGKWVSEIRLPNSRERIWLGSYDTQEKAARAFDAALYCLRGKQAKFNFPDSPPDIAGGTSLNPQEIQAVAAKFANEHTASSSSASYNSSLEKEQTDHFLSLGPLDYSSGPSNSDGGAPTDSDLTAISWPYLDFAEDITFGGLDDYALNFLPSQIDNYDDDEMNCQDYSHASTILWNFD